LDYTSLFPANIFLLFHSHYSPHLYRHLRSLSLLAPSFIFSSFSATRLVIFHRILFSFISFSYFLQLFSFPSTSSLYFSTPLSVWPTDHFVTKHNTVH
jgi:hypothetical protein